MAQPNILVVANPGESEDIARLLTDAGFRPPTVSAGGDETLGVCERAAPHVVVLCASLDQGDSRVLASAIRAAARGAVRLVLLGDISGPIRNALDAADFEVDRFLSRPLSAKALAFAVRTCAAEVQAMLATDVTAPTAPATSTPRPRRASQDARLDRAMDEAISRFVADAMDALDQGWVLDESGEHEVPIQPRDDLETAKVEDPQDVPGWREPTADAPLREPTLILSGGGRLGSGGLATSERTSSIDVTAPETRSPWGPRVAGEYIGLPSPGEDDDIARELGLDVKAMPEDDELIRELDALESSSGTPPPEPLRSEPTPPAAEPSSGNGEGEGEGEGDAPGSAAHAPRAGNLGRELRRRMSMMADRLFPGRGERARVDLGLAHDAHTDIDLTAIGVETESGVGPQATYDEIRGADTFADTNPLSRLEPTPAEQPMTDEGDDTTGRRRAVTGEAPTRGELADVDVATLLGRLLQSRFNGRALFRRAGAEKTVQFEEGRPIFATSNLPHDRMGDLLYREGKITREQQERARDLVVESGRRMGEILVEMGFLKPRELLPAVRHHIEDIVYSLFAWDAGEYALSGAEPSGERIRLTRHPAAIVLEGVRRKYGLEQLETRLGPPSAVVAVRSQRQLAAIAAVADLSPAERAIIQKLDGERTIHQLAEVAQVEQVGVLQLAFGLVALGVAEVVDNGSAAERPPSRGRSLVGETDLTIDRQRVLAKYALVNEADYFTLLGVRRDATSFEIRRAYEAARRDYASGGFPPELQRELAGELTDIGLLIEEAYHVLRDERVRRAYQANLVD